MVANSLEILSDPFQTNTGLVLFGPRKQDQERPAPVSTDDFALPQTVHQISGEVPECEVPHQMPEPAVEFPKPIDVDQGQGKGFTGPAGLFDGTLRFGQNQ